LSHFKAYYSGHYWSPPRLLLALRSYGWVFGLNQGQAHVFSWPLVAGYALTAAILIVAILLILGSLRANPELIPRFHEDALIASFLLLPIILYVVTKLTDGGFTARYMVLVTIGYVLVAARGLRYLSRNALLFVGAALCLSIGIQESGFWFSYKEALELGFTQPKSAEQLVSNSGSQLLVVIADGHDYLEMQHYATPAWKRRFNYLADPIAAVAYGKPDTAEKELLVLREFTPLQVFAFKDFVALAPTFLLFSDPKPDNTPDWWVERLIADGYSVKRIATDGQNTLYLVESRHAP